MNFRGCIVILLILTTIPLYSKGIKKIELDSNLLIAPSSLINGKILTIYGDVTTFDKEKKKAVWCYIDPFDKPKIRWKRSTKILQGTMIMGFDNNRRKDESLCFFYKDEQTITIVDTKTGKILKKIESNWPDLTNTTKKGNIREVKEVQWASPDSIFYFNDSLNMVKIYHPISKRDPTIIPCNIDSLKGFFNSRDVYFSVKPDTNKSRIFNVFKRNLIKRKLIDDFDRGKINKGSCWGLNENKATFKSHLYIIKSINLKKDNYKKENILSYCYTSSFTSKETPLNFHDFDGTNILFSFTSNGYKEVNLYLVDHKEIEKEYLNFSILDSLAESK